jgi:hypothetical protein
MRKRKRKISVRARQNVRDNRRRAVQGDTLAERLAGMSGDSLEYYAAIIAYLEGKWERRELPRELARSLRLERGCIDMEMWKRGYENDEKFSARHPSK